MNATAEAQHSYVPSRGSSERSAWDALTTEERMLCDRWIADEPVEPVELNGLVLRALGY